MLELTGTVYILENSEAHRVKVGVTINDPSERLKDINRMWLGDKGRCQVCLSWRLLEIKSRMPRHVISGNQCAGSNQPPFQKNTELAEQELKSLRGQLKELQGSEKTSAIIRIDNLEKIIKAYRNTPSQVGIWQLQTSLLTRNAYQVELIAHEILSKHLDVAAPIGEVFKCSAQEAMLAIDNALNQLGLYK